MNSAIGGIAVSSVSTEVANKKPAHPDTGSLNVSGSEELEHASRKSVEENKTNDIYRLNRKDKNEGTAEVSQNEIRKMEVKDGDMKTKVYDQSGKLLRVIPPGYVPAGEPKFDVTV